MKITDQELLAYIYESILIEENINGLDTFIAKLQQVYPSIEPHISVIKNFIINSGCVSIVIEPLRFGIGAALASGHVLLSPDIFNYSLERCLYMVFHEIAHQYQFKKYKDRISQLFIDQSDVDSGAAFLKKIETVADQFSIRKCRELANNKILDSAKLITQGAYTHFSVHSFKQYLLQFRQICLQNNITNSQQQAIYFYNFITGKNLETLENL